jgi:ribokinase
MTAPSKASRICVVGSANIDLTFRTHRLPRPGETVSGSHFDIGFGGKGANQAVMAARLGASVSIVAKVGTDAFGQQLADNMKAAGIDTTNLFADQQLPSGTAAIFVDDNAENCIIVAPGANETLLPDHARTAAAAIAGADVVLCQLEVPLDTSIEAFRLARNAGIRTVLNPAPAPAGGVLPAEIVALTDVLVPNETEIESLLPAGSHVRDPQTAAQAAKRLGVSRMIVTLGSEGAILVDGTSAEWVPAFKVKAVDPTGAGDAFIGGLAVFWADGCSLHEAARRASAVAALSVTRSGAQASFPSRQEVDAFLSSV